jgi:hypothetical protein
MLQELVANKGKFLGHNAAGVGDKQLEPRTLQKLVVSKFNFMGHNAAGKQGWILGQNAAESRGTDGEVIGRMLLGNKFTAVHNKFTIAVAGQNAHGQNLAEVASKQRFQTLDTLLQTFLSSNVVLQCCELLAFKGGR